MWLEWIQFFAVKHNVPCYAISYRGHGGSWYPFFLRMYFTTKETLAGDLAAGINHVRLKEGQDVVLVGHSSGGALSQLILSRRIGDIKVRGLALCGAMPCFGGFDVNINWLKFDPWMTIRMFFKHFGHPMSPLSSTRLVKQAFFCDAYPLEKVEAFERYMPRMESFAWPMGQNFRFGTFKNILQQIVGWGMGQRVLVMAGEKDRLVDITVAIREVREAREAYVDLVDSKKIDAKKQDDSGVRYCEVRGAGHHMQNDLQWEDGATALLAFYEQL